MIKRRSWHYIYRLTTVNKKGKQLYYIGYRSCKCLPEEDKNYMSSSQLVKLMMANGVVFNKEIITTFLTRSEAYNAEQDVLKGLKCDVSVSYINIQTDGKPVDLLTRRKKIDHISKNFFNLYAHGIKLPRRPEQKLLRKKLKQQKEMK